MVCFRSFIISVRLKGLEPPRLTAPDPKSDAATNYATTAKCGCKITSKKVFSQIFRGWDDNFVAMHDAVKTVKRHQ